MKHLKSANIFFPELFFNFLFFCFKKMEYFGIKVYDTTVKRYSRSFEGEECSLMCIFPQTS